MWERLEAREISRRAPRPAGDRPRPELPPGTDLLPLIRHIVILMQENHSYDNYLGSLHNIARSPLHHLTSTIQLEGNPTQTWRASHLQYRVGFEENPQDISRGGESFAAEVINRVMHGKGWPHTLLIWTYDEHGGYYDHVVPPAPTS